MSKRWNHLVESRYTDEQISKLLIKVNGPHGDAHDLAKLHLLARRARKKVYWGVFNDTSAVNPQRTHRIIEVFDNVDEIKEREPGFEWYGFKYVVQPIEDEPVFRIKTDENVHSEVMSTEVYGFHELTTLKGHSLAVV